MSNSEFAKGECRHCGGHLEFPAAATGQTIPCPHCGQPIELGMATSKNENGRRRLVILAGAVCAIAAATVILISRHSDPEQIPAPAPMVAVAIAPTNVALVSLPTNPPVETARADEILTNSFGISGGTLLKTPGSSLVYVTGTVRNTSDRQRFGVKVDFALFDTNDVPVGHATDYQSVMEPHGEWDFKAMIMERKGTAAKFCGITEQ